MLVRAGREGREDQVEVEKVEIKGMKKWVGRNGIRGEMWRIVRIIEWGNESDQKGGGMCGGE